MHDVAPATTEVAVIGAGFGGIGATLRLRQLGIDDFVLIERAGEIGGTWRDNTYPGCACDIPSHLYSLADEPKSDWTHKYSRQPEIWDYLREVVERRDLARHLWTEAEVSECRFDGSTARWTLTTTDHRRLEARVVIAAVGPLRDPKYPDLPGMESFHGTAVHTARWDPDLDLTGRRVGVVGTGASAIQIIPEAAGVASRVTVFQRTPAWVVPRMDRPYREWEKRLFERLPLLRQIHRAGIYLTKEARYLAFNHERLMRPLEQLIRWHIRSEIDDDQLVDKLLPDYRMGCKRILVSDDYYPALARSNVDVVDRGVARVTPRGVVDVAGEEHELDVIVWATGYDVKNPLGPLEVHGTDGRDLASWWGERPKAYRGTTVPGFPNLFLLLGPNTGLGHNSVVLQAESQLNYAMDCIDKLRRHPHVAYVDAREDALDRWQQEIVERTTRSVWATGCDSWYLADGHNFTLWPGSTAEYRWRMRRFDTESYRLVTWDELPLRSDGARRTASRSPVRR